MSHTKQFSKTKHVHSKGETKQPGTASALYLCCQDTQEEIASSSICHLTQNLLPDFLRLTAVKISAEWVCCSPAHPEIYCRFPPCRGQWLYTGRLGQFTVRAQRGVSVARHPWVLAGPLELQAAPIIQLYVQHC